MPKSHVDHTTEAKTPPPAVTTNGAPPADSATAAAPTEGGPSAAAAIHELSKAYQDLATKNAANLKAAIQSLAAVKSASEFIDVEKRLIKEGVQAAVSDSQNIAHLTAAVFTAAFEPVKKRIESLQKSTQH